MKKTQNSSLSLRKLILSALVAAPLVTLPAPLWALPSTASTNLTSSSSATSITTAGSTLSITTPDRTVLKWVNFGSGTDTIGATDAIIYNLPSTSSSVLNMVTGVSSTTIGGTLTSNGKIIVLNQNGITLSAGGQITAAGVSLSTRPETEFFYVANGDLGYNGAPTTDVTVNGNISVGSAGNVTLQGRNVIVAGNIDAGSTAITASNAGLGTVTIGGGTAITIGNTTATTPYGNLTVTTDGGTLNISAGAGAVTVAGNSVSLASSGGAVNEGGAGIFQVGNSDATVTINAGAGAVNLTAIQAATAGKTLTTNVTAASATLAAGANKLTVGATTTTGGLTVSTAAGDLKLNTSNIGGALSATATGGDLNSGGTVTVKSGSAITLSAATAGKKITYAGAGNLTFGTITSNGTGTVTLSSSGDIPLPAISTQTLGVTSTGGNITQTGVLAISGTATFNSAGKTDVSTQATNDFGKVVLQGGPSGSLVVDATGVTLEKGTSTTGDVSITAGGAVVLGSASGDTVTVGGKLTIDTSSANGNITDLTDNANVSGNLTLTAGTGAITLDGSAGNGIGLNSQYGQVKVVSAGATTLAEKTTLNLGPITANSLVAYSATSIVNTGKLAIATTTKVGAGTATAPGSINLDFTSATVGAGNAMAGAISFLSDLELLGSPTVGNYLVSNATLVNEGAIMVNVPANIYSQGLLGNLTITGGSIANTANPIVMTSGKLSLNSTGAITADNAANSFASLAVSAGGNVVVKSASTSGLSVDATLAGAAGNANTATFTATAGDLTIGSVTSNFGGLTTFDASTGGSVKDSVAGISIYGDATFTAKNDVTINKSGHNFGGVTLTTANDSKTLTLVEGGTLKLVSVNSGNKKATINLTSTSGDIIQTGAIKGSDNTKVATFNASNGKVTLTNAGNVLKERVDIKAAGDASFTNNGADTLLGNVTTLGKLAVVDSTANAITQGSGTKIFAYGDTSVTTALAGVITLTNTGNNFGGLILTSGSGDIALTEGGTLNVKSAQTSGKLSLTSENANIIDTVDSSVANNNISNGGAAIGSATFTANNGSVTLDNPGNAYSTVALATKGDAAVTQSTGLGDITLGASTVSGALTVTNAAAGKNILQNGTLTVLGNSTFNTNSGAVILGDSANQFGAVRFKVGLSSSITENTSFNLNSGSIATAPVIVNTNGDFLTSGVGGSSFTSNLTINAIGKITPGSGSMLVTGTFTVFSNNTKDLSALSKSGNLAGNDPVNLGTGTYVPPSP